MTTDKINNALAGRNTAGAIGRRTLFKGAAGLALALGTVELAEVKSARLKVTPGT